MAPIICSLLSGEQKVPEVVAWQRQWRDESAPRDARYVFVCVAPALKTGPVDVSKTTWQPFSCFARTNAASRRHSARAVRMLRFCGLDRTTRMTPPSNDALTGS